MRVVRLCAVRNFVRVWWVWCCFEVIVGRVRCFASLSCVVYLFGYASGSGSQSQIRFASHVWFGLRSLISLMRVPMHQRQRGTIRPWRIARARANSRHTSFAQKIINCLHFRVRVGGGCTFCGRLCARGGLLAAAPELDYHTQRCICIDRHPAAYCLYAIVAL